MTIYINRYTDETISQELKDILRKNGICLDELTFSLWNEFGGQGVLSYKEIVSLLFNPEGPDTYGWEEIERLLCSQSATSFLSQMENNIRLLKHDYIKWDEIEEILFDTEEAA